MRHVLAFVIAVFLAIPASAAQRTFVSYRGSDLNSCAVDAPCRSFAAAIAQTNANGEVVAVDSAGYGPVTITQAVTIVAPLGVHAGISVFSGDGVTINAGAVDIVVLRNLYINSQGGVNGVTLSAAAALHIEHCVVSGFSARDINLLSATKVEINDTIVRHAGASGIYANGPTGLHVSIDHCRIESNDVGVLVDQGVVGIGNSTVDNSPSRDVWAQGSGGAVSMVIESSVLSHSQTGALANVGTDITVHNTSAFDMSGSGFVANGGKLFLDNCVAARSADGVAILSGGEASITACTIANNTSFGVYVSNPGTARLSRNTISGNGTGINNFGIVHSTGDNMVDGNTTETTGGAIIAANKA